MSREQREQLPAAGDDHKRQIMQKIIIARLIMARAKTPEEWRAHSQNFMADTDRQLTQGLITTRKSRQGQVNPSKNPEYSNNQRENKSKGQKNEATLPNKEGPNKGAAPYKSEKAEGEKRRGAGKEKEPEQTPGTGGPGE